MQRFRKRRLNIVIGLALLFSACTTQPTLTPTGAVPAPTPTATLPPLATATLTAVPATALPPTTTPQPIVPSAASILLSPTIITAPTQVVAMPTPHGDGPCAYRATFLGDVTIPDDTQVAPGTAFVKTWRVRNDGTCTWGAAGYAVQALAFYDGDRLGTLSPIELPEVVPPGSVIDLSVNMIAPQNPGTYRSDWMLSVAGDPNGLRWLGFGPSGNAPLYAEIVVPAPIGF